MDLKGLLWYHDRILYNPSCKNAIKSIIGIGGNTIIILKLPLVFDKIKQNMNNKSDNIYTLYIYTL